MNKRNHKNRGIINQISKRFQTTIIGSLARFEENFGYLWDPGEDRELSQKERDFLDMWEHTRTSILNNGNSQMRQAMDEIIDFIDNHNNKFHYDFIIDNNLKEKK
jgi:hypothetical protein